MPGGLKTIGVLGGMGPVATADFFSRIVAGVGSASCDQDHPPCLVYNACDVPDRTAHLTADGEDPTDALITAASILEQAGADFVAIPCNTAHAYLEPITQALTIPVINMVGLAAEVVSGICPRVRTAGVLAASGTLQLGLYHQRLKERGIEPIHPEPPIQEKVMAVIRRVKAGGRNVDSMLVDVADKLVEAGAEALVLGCTELPLAFDPAFESVPVVDATDTLVLACLRAAGVQR